MKSGIIKAIVPPAVLALQLSMVLILPRHEELVESSISPDLPLDYDLPGWRGTKIQESEKERSVLAADTRFSKAHYIQPPRVPWEKSTPPIEISIVYSGNDMNSSIHRPERCLPAQGHVNLEVHSDTITLADGRTIAVSRLTSQVPLNDQKRGFLNFIHYYVFIGHGSMHHTHLGRTMQDIYDRIVLGQVQRWAYFQAGTCWAPALGITEEEADQKIRNLISELLPGQVDWQKL